MAERERMTSVDTAWLRMDRPSNRMVIVGVLKFGSPLTLDRLRRVVGDRLLRYARFRQRPCQRDDGYWWEEDRKFDLARHVVAHRSRARLGDPQLRELAGKLAAAPLDPDRPLWQFTLAEDQHGGTALIVRVHHCYADGIALIGVMLSLTDPVARPGRHKPRKADPAPRTSAGDDSMVQRFLEPVSKAVMSLLHDPTGTLEKYSALISSPGRLLEFARMGSGIGLEVAKLATMADDSATRYKGTPGVAKRVAWNTPIPLDDIKAASRALGCSVNDVLLSCVAGALSRHLRARGDDVTGIEIRAMVPVNLRSQGSDQELGNRFGLVALTLPLGIFNPVARVLEVNRRMSALKGSFQAPLTLGILGLVGACPPAVQDQVLDLLAAKATAVMTNVPGPQQPLWLAGARVDDILFWVPQSGNIGMGVSILSYNNRVQFGLITDAGLTPDPQAIVDGFAPELETVILTLLMEPWDGLRDPDAMEADLAAALSPPASSASRASPPSSARRKRPRDTAPPAARTGHARRP